MTPKEELESLLNAGIQTAGQMLQESGGFVPYGLILDATGDTRTISPVADVVDPDDIEPRLSDEFVELLHEKFRGEAATGAIKATAVFVSVTIQPKGGPETEAVMVGLEHCDGETMNVYLPYKFSASGEVAVGELFAEAREGVVF